MDLLYSSMVWNIFVVETMGGGGYVGYFRVREIRFLIQEFAMVNRHVSKVKSVAKVETNEEHGYP